MSLKSGRKSKISEEDRIKTDSSRAYTFNIKSLNGEKKKIGGNQIKHKPSSYGMAIKWLIYIKRMTYKEFAFAYNGTTAQNANHLINRIRKDRFFEDDLNKMCEVLNVSFDYLCKLADGIEKLMELKIDANIK